jgi:NADP-dependent 3-hydroxy acid dehydrogenase YdfG
MAQHTSDESLVARRAVRRARTRAAEKSGEAFAMAPGAVAAAIAHAIDQPDGVNVGEDRDAFDGSALTAISHD